MKLHPKVIRKNIVFKQRKLKTSGDAERIFKKYRVIIRTDDGEEVDPWKWRENFMKNEDLNDFSFSTVIRRFLMLESKGKVKAGEMKPAKQPSRPPLGLNAQSADDEANLAFGKNQQKLKAGMMQGGKLGSLGVGADEALMVDDDEGYDYGIIQTIVLNPTGDILEIKEERAKEGEQIVGNEDQQTAEIEQLRKQLQQTKGKLATMFVEMKREEDKGHLHVEEALAMANDEVDLGTEDDSSLLDQVLQKGLIPKVPPLNTSVAAASALALKQAEEKAEKERLENEARLRAQRLKERQDARMARKADNSARNAQVHNTYLVQMEDEDPYSFDPSSGARPRYSDVDFSGLKREAIPKSLFGKGKQMSKPPTSGTVTLGNGVEIPIAFLQTDDFFLVLDEGNEKRFVDNDLDREKQRDDAAKKRAAEISAKYMANAKEYMLAHGYKNVAEKKPILRSLTFGAPKAGSAPGGKPSHPGASGTDPLLYEG
jgi:hypothetical protein